MESRTLTRRLQLFHRIDATLAAQSDRVLLSTVEAANPTKAHSPVTASQLRAEARNWQERFEKAGLQAGDAIGLRDERQVVRGIANLSEPISPESRRL